MLPNEKVDSDDDDDDDDDDELPYSSKIQPASRISISSQHPRRRSHDENLRQQRRSAIHAKLCAYEAKRRTAYESKLQSSSLYWHAFRTLMHDSLLETHKAYMLVNSWNFASKIYGKHMKSISEWCIDEKEGIPIIDGKKKKKKILEKSSLIAAEYYREEQCGSVIQNFANVAGLAAGQYEEMGDYMNSEILPELLLLSDRMKSEVVLMEKLGDSIMNELEAAEDEVCSAWDAYYRKSLDFFSSSTMEKERLKSGVATVPPPERSSAHHDNLSFNSTGVKEGCADVWIVELRYRMAVAFLSSVWDKCSSELSKLFLSMKDAECNRRNVIKDLMIKVAKRQESQWLELPSLASPLLKELDDWPTAERKVVEDDVQHSIRERAQTIQLDEAMHEKKAPSSDAESSHSGLTEAVNNSEDGNFELSSPLVSDLMCRARVIEKRSPGMISAWKLSLAVITLDSYLHLFELPPSCKLLHAGSSPELAFQNLIPPVLVPSMEGLKEGVRIPTAKHWFDNLVPSESFALPNCTMALHKDEERNPGCFEIVETMLTSGASKMFTKTLNKKMQFRAVSREDAQDFVDSLKSFSAMHASTLVGKGSA